MTTQIKFRGFRADGKGWVEGGYANGCIIDEYGIDYEIHPSSLGMFTGLTDKNGKEIFGAIGEKGGDIMKAQFALPLCVVYENGGFCFENEHSSGSDRLHQIRTEKLEIIGNQFEQDNGR